MKMYDSSKIAHIQATLCNPDDKLWMLFNALGDCARYRMVKVLMHHQGLSVTELAHIIGVSVSAVSQQLKYLELTEVVSKQRQGQVVYYRLNTTNDYVVEVVKLIDEWLGN